MRWDLLRMHVEQPHEPCRNTKSHRLMPQVTAVQTTTQCHFNSPTTGVLYLEICKNKKEKKKKRKSARVCPSCDLQSPRLIMRLSVTQMVAVNSPNVSSALTGQSGSAGSSVLLTEFCVAKLLVGNMQKNKMVCFGRDIVARGWILTQSTNKIQT